LGRAFRSPVYRIGEYDWGERLETVAPARDPVVFRDAHD
jgi:hypothetical protein